MEKEQEIRLKLVRRGIQWLENRAISDQKLVHPDEQEIYLTHQQIITELMRTTKREGETLTQLNLNAKGQDMTRKEPSIFVTYHGKLREFQQNKQLRDTNRQKKMKENEDIYFRKAAQALQLNAAAIDTALSEGDEAAIELFSAALNSFPSVPPEEFRISNDGFLPILFNLGSCLFNEGDLEEGFKLLTNYFDHTNAGDYYRDRLQELFHIEKSYENRRSIITAAYQGINFTRDRHGVVVELNGVETFNIIELPFKQPVSLEIELKDKDSPELLDYYYLQQILPSPEEGVARYEILLPLKKIPAFIKEFYPSILDDPSLRHELIKDFEEQMTDLSIAEARENSRKRTDYPELYTDYFKSVLFINVPNHLNDAFLEEYRQFIKAYVVHEISDNEKDEQELARLKKDYENHKVWYRSQLKKEFKLEYKHHQQVAEMYADLKVLEENLLLNKKDPFNTSKDPLRKEYKQSYLKLLNGVFDDIHVEEEVEETAEKRFERINFRSSDLNDSIHNYWTIMQQLLEVEPSAALAKMRFVLEEILSAILEQENHTLYGENYRLTPTQMVLKIQKEIGEELKDTITQLHLKAKSNSHFEENQYGAGGERRSEAEEILQRLHKAITDLVHLFNL